ncbi:MAG: BtaA family protein [Burkholderiales bacterium]|nr:BtaA family protein [Burkholderiales bacterium]
MRSEAAGRASFDIIRYAQCWEDADVLLGAMHARAGQTLVSIASAGDNTLALLTLDPERVYALDLSSAQLACLELRVAAYRALDHAGLLELVGSRPSARRRDLYAACRPGLCAAVRDFWDAHGAQIDAGIGGAGKFERYFALFRDRVLPLVHARRTVLRLLEPRAREAREAFYAREWNTWRWRLLFRLFFSRFVMGRLGRDTSFFRYVEGGVADRILARTRYALTELDPAKNPYLGWILTGTHGAALPLALRAEHFEAIRARVDRVAWHAEPLEAFVERLGPRAVDGFNLSDIFEYMSEANYARLLERLLGAARPGARIAYWNMLAPRRRPEALAGQLTPRRDLSEPLFAADKAFFYSDFVVEEAV